MENAEWLPAPSEKDGNRDDETAEPFTEESTTEKGPGHDDHAHDQLGTSATDGGANGDPAEKTALEKETATLQQRPDAPPASPGRSERTAQLTDAQSTRSPAGERFGAGVLRPDNRRLDTAATADSTTTSTNLPRLRRKETRLAQKEAHPWQHLGITLGLPMILLFDLVVPCVIYYTWYNSHVWDWKNQCSKEYPNQDCPIEKPQFDQSILGSAIASFGVGELWILIARVHRLFFHRKDCAPLLSRSRWELDATSWVYAVALITSLIPFVISSSLVIPKLYLYSPTFIMAFLGTLMLITICVPFKLPIGINSQPRGTRLRPLIYYAAEDFMAVDGLQDREFRVRFNERYDTNKMFRRFFLYLTLWWIFGVCVYIGCVSAVIWTLEFHYAFGASLGVLFSYIAIWAAISAVWTNLEMKREHKAYEEGKFDV